MAKDILITTESLKTILPVYENKILEQVKSNMPKGIEPEYGDIPMVFITGNVPTSKDYVFGELEYMSKTLKFHAYTRIKLQGNSTLLHPKKNFTVNLYKDETCSIQLNKEFKNWGLHNNFVLKADYIDILHARNVVTAKLWSKTVASRSDYDTLPEELRNSPNNGAIDGFPVKVYINGDYVGLYNWTIPKCDWQFGLSSKNVNHALLSAQINDNGNTTLEYNPCNFNRPWRDDEYTDALDIEVGSAERITIQESFNKIFIYMSESDEDLVLYLDMQSAIDYFIFQDVILGIDGLAKNMLLVTYDMTKWYLSAYDLDSTFDLDWHGNLLNSYNAVIGNVPYLNNYSNLLRFIQENYLDEYIARYIELRNSVLSEASIISAFEEYIGIYGEDLYIQDTISYPDIPSVTENTLKHLKVFIKDRLAFLDNKYKVVI